MLPPFFRVEGWVSIFPEMLVLIYQTSRCRNSDDQNIDVNPVKTSGTRFIFLLVPFP